MPSISIQNKFPTFVLTPIAATKLNPPISSIEKDLFCQPLMGGYFLLLHGKNANISSYGRRH